MMCGRAGRLLLAACAALVLFVPTARADEAAELRALVDKLSHRVEELEHQLDEVQPTAGESADGLPKGRLVIDDTALKKIVADYLQENPGAGMPPGVQTGYYPSQGFVLRSPAAPSYFNWKDECAIPFELRIRGLAQVAYDFYKATDATNHLTGLPVEVPFGDFSQIEVKRARLMFDGTAFTPNLRYCMEVDGSTLGVPGFVNTGRPALVPTVTGNAPGTPLVTVGQAVRLYQTYVAYDWKPCCADKGCGAACPDGTIKYAPTVTFITGKYRPFFAFEQYLGDGNQQFVDYAMADWFFDADDDNLQTQAGVQLRACEDRLFATVNVSNGNESQTANIQLDDKPGCNGGFWYDFGGTWNAARQRWDLYGDTVADLAYSCQPVVRAGAMFDLVPMDRRSLYGVGELQRVYAAPGAPGGTPFISLFNGGSSNTFTPRGEFALDAFDSYSFETFVAGKWRGFSFLADGWVRLLDNFRPTPVAGPNGPIIYSITEPDGTITGNFLFQPHTIIDYGAVFQGGYFLVPGRVELAARWSWIRGQSGNIYGDGTVARTLVIDGVPVTEFHDAFRRFQEADEYTVGLNYYLRGEQLKWQTDFGVYRGGNPAGNGQPMGGFLSGVDGWLVRTQIQLWF
jgi:hypothetical protein